MGKEIGDGDLAVFQQPLHGRLIDLKQPEAGLEISPGHGKGGTAAGEMVRAQDDNPAVTLGGHPGEGLGQKVRGQEVVRYGQAGDFCRKGRASGIFDS